LPSFGRRDRIVGCLENFRFDWIPFAGRFCHYPIAREYGEIRVSGVDESAVIDPWVDYDSADFAHFGGPHKRIDLKGSFPESWHLGFALRGGKGRERGAQGKEGLNAPPMAEPRRTVPVYAPQAMEQLASSHHAPEIIMRVGSCQRNLDPALPRHTVPSNA